MRQKDRDNHENQKGSAMAAIKALPRIAKRMPV